MFLNIYTIKTCSSDKLLIKSGLVQQNDENALLILPTIQDFIVEPIEPIFQRT